MIEAEELNVTGRVLIVEDEADLRDLLAYNLKTAGHDVCAVATGQEALVEWARFAPQVVLLDLMLPDLPGTEICRRIRADRAKPQPGILMLTARSEEIDRVVGFEVGADDYVVKPFSVRELVLRVAALLRRRSGAEAPAPRAPLPVPQRRMLEVGPLTVDIDGHHVFVGGRELYLSSMEMRLLIDLVEHRGRVRSREELLEDVWGYRPGISTRTVDTHVKRLRDKLASAGHLIETVRGTGYRLSNEHAVRQMTADVAMAERGR